MQKLVMNLRKIWQVVEENECEDEMFSDFLAENYARKADQGFYDVLWKIYQEMREQIDCMKCANCCSQIDVLLTDNDILNFSQGINLSVEEFNRRYVNETKFGKEFQKPCPFLEGKKCKYYVYRPQICQTYPFNNDERIEALFGSVLGNYTRCPIMFNVFMQLKEYYWIEYEQDGL